MFGFWARVLNGGQAYLMLRGVPKGPVASFVRKVLSRLHGDAKRRASDEDRRMLQTRCRITLICAMGGVFPAFFRELHMHDIHVLSYVRSVEDPWPAGEFTRQEVGVLTRESVTLQVAERGVYMADGPWLSELRWHNGDGRQMAIISSDHALDLQRIAGSLQLEFTAARFLSYQRDNPTLDRVGHVTSRNVNQPNEYQPGQGCRSDSAGANAFLQSVKLIAFRAQDMLMHTLYERDPNSSMLMACCEASSRAWSS